MTCPVQELLLELHGVTQNLTHELRRGSTEAEIAGRLGVTPQELREARQAAGPAARPG